MPPTTGKQTQRLKLEWLTKEESLLEQSIKSEGSCLGKAPMVLVITLRDTFPECSLSSIFSKGNVMEQPYNLEAKVLI